MKFTPKTKQEKFGLEVYNALVENFPQTFFVGGAVRDMLLKKPVTDIDLATSAAPQEVVDVLKKYFIECNFGYQNLGVVVALRDGMDVSVTTFRSDVYGESRYPEVHFATSAKADAKRRDFTVNALYFSPKNGKILDFYGGLKDIVSRTVRFIGTPSKRIQEDPLRIVRALRFAIGNRMRIEKKSLQAIQKYFPLVKNISKSRLEKEIKKLLHEPQRKKLREVINNEKILDKYF